MSGVAPSTCYGCPATWTPGQPMVHADTCRFVAGVSAATPQYGPAWIAACYGVTVNDPCPVVTLPAATVAA